MVLVLLGAHLRQRLNQTVQLPLLPVLVTELLMAFSKSPECHSARMPRSLSGERALLLNLQLGFLREIDDQLYGAVDTVDHDLS